MGARPRAPFGLIFGNRAAVPEHFRTLGPVPLSQGRGERRQAGCQGVRNLLKSTLLR